MLVQDQMTGYVSEVPDHLYGYEGYYGEYPENIGESQMLYDGLGNPVGLFPLIPKIASLASKALPAVSSIASRIPGVGRLFGGGRRPGLPIPPGLPMPRLPFPLPVPFPRPGGMPSRPPWPLGWVRPQLPYTGLGPRRLYLRCAVWPGPRGLVPAAAAQALPAAPGTPAAAAQQAAATAAAAAAAAAAGRRRRRRRRR